MQNDRTYDAHELTPAWSPAHDAAAAREGWNIWDSAGSANGRWQVQRIDDADAFEQATGFAPVQLKSDDQAFHIVANGTAEHHAAARAFLKAHNAVEYDAVMAFKGQAKPQTGQSKPSQLWACDQETGREFLRQEGDEAELRVECRRLADHDRDVWLIRADGMKELPSGKVIDPKAEANTDEAQPDSGAAAQHPDSVAINKATADALAWTLRFIQTYAPHATGPCTPELNKAKAALAAAVALQQREAAPFFAYVQEGGSSVEMYLHTFNSEDEAQCGRVECSEGSYRTSPVVAVPGQFGSAAFHAVVEDILKASTNLDYPSAE